MGPLHVELSLSRDGWNADGKVANQENNELEKSDIDCAGFAIEMLVIHCHLMYNEVFQMFLQEWRPICDDVQGSNYRHQAVSQAKYLTMLSVF